MTGAPASFDVFAVSPEGFEVHFQLAGEKVYSESRKLLAQMVKDGYAPRPAKGARKPPAVQGPLCEAHGVHFREYSKDGKTWQAHQLDDGTWCHQRPEVKAAK